MRDKYHLKINKKAFFYPDQWNTFYNTLKESQQPYFKIAINTGGRYNEIKHLRVDDIDFERNTLTFYITKVKAKKKETRPTPRTIPISNDFKIWLQRWIKRNRLRGSDTFGIPSNPAISKTIKGRLKKQGLKDYNDFSSHNVRKTHGNWLKAIGVDSAEIALRLGHDMNTMLSSYVSPNIFSEGDKALIKQELGDLYKNEN